MDNLRERFLDRYDTGGEKVTFCTACHHSLKRLRRTLIMYGLEANRAQPLIMPMGFDR